MKYGKGWNETLIEEGDEVVITSASTIEGRWVRPEEGGLYRHDGKRLVREDGYVLSTVIADPDPEC